MLHLGICAAVAPTWVAFSGLLVHALWWRKINAAWCLPLLALPYLLSPTVESINGRLVLVMATTGLAVLAFAAAGNRKSNGGTNKIDPCLLVIHAAIIMGVLVGVNTLTRHLNLATASFDLGNLDNVVFNLTEGHGQASPMERNNPAVSHFQVHFSPMLALLTPIYRLAPNAGTLLWIQAALVPISTFLCMKMAGAILKNRAEGAAMGAIWLFYPLTQYPLFYDMHDLKLYPMWLFACGWALAEKHKVTPWIFALVAIGMKEDVPIVCAPAFVVLGLMTERKKTGMALGLMSIAYFAAIKTFWITPNGENWMGMYSHLNAGGMGSLAEVALREPERILKQIWQERTLTSALLTLAPLAFLPLRTVWGTVLLAVPLAIIWLPERDVFTTMGFHYNFLVAPMALLAALRAIQLATEENRKKLLVVALIAAGACIPTVSILSPFQDFRGGFAMLRLPIKTNPESREALKELKEWENELQWDKHTVLASSEPLAAHISSRHEAYTTRDWRGKVPATIPETAWPKYIVQFQGEPPIKGYQQTRGKRKTAVSEKAPN